MKKEELKYIQKELGLTSQQMANALKVSKPTYDAWLYGINSIPEIYHGTLWGWYHAAQNQKQEEVLDLIKKSAHVAGIAWLAWKSMDYLFSDDEDNPKDVNSKQWKDED